MDRLLWPSFLLSFDVCVGQIGTGSSNNLTMGKSRLADMKNSEVRDLAIW